MRFVLGNTNTAGLRPSSGYLIQGKPPLADRLGTCRMPLIQKLYTTLLLGSPVVGWGRGMGWDAV